MNNETNQFAALESTVVLTDWRWPAWTGIGRMATFYAESRPDNFVLRDVEAASRIGSPLSPFTLSLAVGRCASAGSIFWNPGFIPVFSKTIPTIVTVHDLTHLHFYSKMHRYYYNTILKPMYRNTDSVICISEFTRNEFLEWSGMDPARVKVIYNCLPKGFAEQADKPKVERPYIFYAGNHRSYKNLQNLILAFARSALASDGFELKLTGEPTAVLVEAARAAGVIDDVTFTGRLSDDEIVQGYKGATCVTFLSRYEGFGLPILEAMACSTPVIIANASCLPEIAGDAALSVDPDDLEAISDALRRVAIDSTLASQLRQRGRDRLLAFDPQVSSKLLWQNIADTRRNA